MSTAFKLHRLHLQTKPYASIHYTHALLHHTLAGSPLNPSPNTQPLLAGNPFNSPNTLAGSPFNPSPNTQSPLRHRSSYSAEDSAPLSPPDHSPNRPHDSTSQALDEFSSHPFASTFSTSLLPPHPLAHTFARPPHDPPNTGTVYSTTQFRPYMSLIYVWQDSAQFTQFFPLIHV